MQPTWITGRIGPKIYPNTISPTQIASYKQVDLAFHQIAVDTDWTNNGWSAEPLPNVGIATKDD